jgi:hypothetical protein
VGVLLIVGLIVGGFVALLGTFSVIARFGPGMQVKVSVIMIALSVISVAVGPLYDMLLWTIIQSIATVIWFLFYPTDPFIVGGVLGPVVLLAGVTTSVLILCASLSIPMLVWELLLIDAYRGVNALLTIAQGILLIFVCGPRVVRRWRTGLRALRSLEARAR